jgi:hypothetical protein
MKTTMEFHPSLKKVFRDIHSWFSHACNAGSLEENLHDINVDLGKPGALTKGASVTLDGLGRYYTNQACALFGDDDFSSISQSLFFGVSFRSLAFRYGAMHWTEESYKLVPPAFKTSMKVAGSAMLSKWDETEACARFLIALAEKNLTRYEDKDRKDDWGKNTIPAFLIALFCEVFKLETFYYPVNPLIPQFQALLDHWKTKDKALYRTVMQAAAEFHISRSKNSTSKINYEFDTFVDTVFPAELLTIQALRRRDGLPEFDTGHLLIDAPWAVIRDLPEVEPHPLLAVVEARIRHDYPAFR